MNETTDSKNNTTGSNLLREAAIADKNYQQESNFSAAGAIDFALIWSAIFRSRFWILGIIIGSLLVGILISLLTSPLYQARATVQIDQNAAKVIGTEETDQSASMKDSDRFLQTQLDIVRSRALATAVAEDENLFGNKAFLESMGADSDVKSKGVLSQEDTERELVIEVLDDNLSVSLPLDSRVASITFSSYDPVLAARIANSFIENYVRSNLQRKFDNSVYAREFLQEQLDGAAARLEASERESLAYARRTKIIDTSNAAEADGVRSSPQSLTTATLVQLNQQYAASFSRRLSAQKKWETARKSSLFAMPEVLSSDLIQNLLEQKAKLEAEQKEQLERRKEDYPTVRQLNARIVELDEQITTISSGIRQSLRGNYQTALAEERALKAEITKMKGETLDEQTQSVQLGILRRATETNRELYDLLLTRFNELNAEAGVQSNNVSIIDPAVPPVEPIKPDIPLNLALSLLFGFGLSGLFVFGREQIFDTIRTPEDIERKLGLSVLGTIPKTKADTDLVAEILDRKTGIAEAHSSVRTSLMLASSHGVPRSIMFTSSQQGEGKSSNCFATAVTLSKVGKKVVVIDMDLRRPNQHNFFQRKNNLGVSNVLSQNRSLDDVIQKTDFDNIDTVTSGPVPPNPTELLASGHAEDLIKKLETQYDVVLIDSPPLLGLADAVMIGSIAESCLFVVEAGRNQTSSIRSAVGRLLQGGASLTGTLLNRFDPKGTGYSYDYAYQYEYKK